MLSAAALKQWNVWLRDVNDIYRFIGIFHHSSEKGAISFVRTIWEEGDDLRVERARSLFTFAPGKPLVCNMKATLLAPAAIKKTSGEVVSRPKPPAPALEPAPRRWLQMDLFPKRGAA